MFMPMPPAEGSTSMTSRPGADRASFFAAAFQYSMVPSPS
jgi:hypothetical protein